MNPSTSQPGAHPAARRTDAILSAGALLLDRTKRTARAGNTLLPLRNKQFDLLATLLVHEGQAMERDELLSQVWGYDIPGRTRTVDVHINQLRRHLHGAGVAIETVRGRGYRLIEKPEPDA